MRSLGTYVAAVLCFVALAAPAAAQAHVTVKKDGTGDYTGIQEALEDPMRVYDEIVVYPGVYTENIFISSNITLRAFEGPYLTCIDGSLRQRDGEVENNTVSVNRELDDVRISGFYITRGEYGLYIATSSQVLIANCVFHDNDSHGVYAKWDSGTDVSSLSVYNNVFMQNGGAGLYLFGYTSGGYFQDQYVNLFYAFIYNNIFSTNDDYGMRTNSSPAGAYNASRVEVNYNCLHNNTPAAYGGYVGTSQAVVPGLDDISDNPMFVGQDVGPGLDVRLLDASPCRNAGQVAVTANDPDGTRNDIGAYGGPYAATFFESPVDGPIVRDVSITPGSVPQGETFTVEATVAVR